MAYDSQKIRALLTEGFDIDELRRFCFDHPSFRAVHHQLSPEMGKDKVIDRLLEHAEQTLQYDPLLAWAKELNPSRYEQHGTYWVDRPVLPPTLSSPGNLEHKARVFLCHASEDKPQVIELYHQLKKAGYNPWLDKEDLLPGQSWRQEIEKIVRDPFNLVLVCLSHKSTTKRGVVQQEIKWALDVLDQMPEDAIYLIPARLEACQVPDRLSNLHWVDLFEPDGFVKLKQALDFEIDKRKPPFEPEMVLIPAGEFLMGSNPNLDNNTRPNEQPQHRLYLPDYFMARTPVTNTQYAVFVQAAKYPPPDSWPDGQFPEERPDHPVVKVSWMDALAYCQWLTQATGRTYRLPCEAEWEKAARGNDGRIYPWGNEWDQQRCNSKKDRKSSPNTTPVGSYPDGASPYGLLDMAGNVAEWCATIVGKLYPYDTGEDESSIVYLRQGGNRVLRGGSWGDDPDEVRCAARLVFTPYIPGGTSSHNGFRVVSPYNLIAPFHIKSRSGKIS